MQQNLSTMGDQMFETLYTTDLILSPKHVDLEDKENLQIRNEFHVFRDYLGLINLVQPEGFGSHSFRSASSLSPQSIDSIFDYAEFVNFPARKRLDSLDSDQSGNSLGSHGEGEMSLLLDSMNAQDMQAYKPSIIGEPLSQRQDFFANRPTGKVLMKTGKVTSILSASEKQRAGNTRQVCVFCRNNGENKEFYSGHTLKDSEGNTTCPILRAYTCPLCKACGDKSHTIKYCPKYTPKPKDKILPI